MAAASVALSVGAGGPSERAATPPGFRAFCALVIVLAMLVASYGLYWDIQWHEFVGRDTFLIPPHVLLYAGIAIAGVTALLSILYESLFRNAQNGSVSFLWLFRGARGMFVTGFGLLFVALAAPLDDYWHRLYGLDATLWAPFHIMGFSGSLLATIGILYTLAGLANGARKTRWKLFDYNLYEWFFFLELAALFGLAIILSQPALRLVPQIGDGPFAIFPAMLIWSVPLTLWTVSAVVYASSGGAALALLGVWLVRAVAFGLTVPLAVQRMVIALGMTYRNPDHVPVVAPLSLVPLLVLAPGVLVIAVAGRRGSVSLGAGALASSLFAIGAGVWILGANDGRVTTLQAVPLTLALAAIGGAVATWIARGFGMILQAE